MGKVTRRLFLGLPFLLVSGRFPPPPVPRKITYCTVWAGHADREYAVGTIIREDPPYGIWVDTDGRCILVRYDQVVRRH